MHLPYLAELPDVELRALVDPAERRVAELADRYNVPHRFQSGTAMFDALEDDLDAVLVLTPAHAHCDVVVEALEADVHTLVEKPLAATPADADRMVEAAERSSAVAMVAYMKRYDPTYERAQTELDSFGEIDLVTAYDVDPDHPKIIHEVYDIVEADLPRSFLEESGAERTRQIECALGTDDEELVAAYDFQLDHVCHDVNALRGLFGDVEQVSHVDVFADGRYATAHLTFQGGHRCILESGDSDRKWFEQFVRVDGPDGMLRLDFSNPFIKNTPTELQVKRGTDELDETTHVPSYEEPFKRELDHFVRCARSEESVRTTFEEARDDLQVIVDLFQTYREQATPVH